MSMHRFAKVHGGRLGYSTMARWAVATTAVAMACVALADEAPIGTLPPVHDGDPPSPHVKQRIVEVRKMLDEGGQSTTDEQARAITVLALIAIAQEEQRPGGNIRTVERALLELRHYPESVSGITFLVQSIGCRVSAILRPGNRLYGYPAATALLRIGLPARDQLLVASRELTDPEIHLRAYVLAKLEQTRDDVRSGPPIAVFRIMREIETIDSEPVAAEREDRKQARIKNLRRMASLLLDPGFLWEAIPLPLDEKP